MWRSFNYFTCLRTQIILSLTRCKYKGLKSLHKECRKNYTVMQKEIIYGNIVIFSSVDTEVPNKSGYNDKIRVTITLRLALKKRAMFISLRFLLSPRYSDECTCARDIRITRIPAALFGIRYSTPDSLRYYRYR